MPFLDEATIAAAAHRLAGRNTKTLGPPGNELRALLGGAEKKVAKALAKALRDGSYRPSPALITQQMFDKLRDIFVFQPLDFLAHSAFAAALSEAMEPTLSGANYAYRKGYSNKTALHDFAEFLRGYQREVHDPKARGLYVLRADIKSYADSIPLHEGSALWDELARVTKLEAKSVLFDQLRRICRVEVEIRRGVFATVLRGVPLGSPIGPPLMSVYLHPLDAALETLAEGGFYARYCDDFVFVHPDPAKVREAIALTHRLLDDKLLRLNPKKLRVHYFTGAARKSSEWPEADASDVVGFVGADVRFDGTLLLGKKKHRELLRGLDARLRAARPSLERLTGDDRARAAIAVANSALDEHHPFRLPHVVYLRQIVTDRGFLKDMDFRVARLVAQASAGTNRWQAFREFSPRRLRQTLGLLSLVARRNDD